MSSFFTRTGDDGYTGLLGEGRVPKYHPRTEANGDIDEATAALGFARAISQAPQTAPLLIKIQRQLYSLMSEVAATPENAAKFRTIDSDTVTWLEEQADQLSALVTIPNEFILPGDSPAGGAMSLARAVVRRAERRLVKLLHEDQLENHELARYLNRLSSLCFVLELLENQVYGKSTATLAKEAPPR